MKRIFQTILPVIAILFIFSACGSVHDFPAGPPREQFTGTWTLSTVTFSGLADDAVPTIFDDAAPKAFTGSTWQFDKSGNGSYTLTNGATQNIYWSVNSGDALGKLFHFKKVKQGEDPQNVQTSYQMVISNNTDASMILKMLVFGGNKNGYVVYTFNKVKS